MESTHTKTFTVTEDLHASQGQRLGNYLLDLIIQYAMSAGLGVVAVLLARLTGNYGFASWIQDMDGIDEYLLGAVIMIVYYFTIESLTGRSFGKLVTKTVIVMEDGSKPDAITILKRTFCRLIPFEHFSFLGSSARGWHDSIPNTYVVRKKDFEESRDLFYSFEEIGTTPSIDD